VTAGEKMVSHVSDNKRAILPVLGYYGTGRVWRQKKLTRSQSSSPGSRLIGYRNSLDPSSDERRLLKWFKTRELVALQKKKKLDDLDAVRFAIQTCISDADEVYWDMETDQLAIRFDKEITWFKNLSDGYRNMLAMVADIAQRCVTLNPHLGKNAIRETPGIVLIDEIDLHLHPKWQQRVVADLLKAFPQVQFVATTHSPFIIQSLVAKKGIKLINLDKPEATDFTNKSVEDVTEELQGVNDPPPQRSKHYQEMIQAAEAYYRLLQKIPQAPKDEVEALRTRLDKLAQPFSDDPAYQAFLNMQRIAAGVDGENGHAPR